MWTAGDHRNWPVKPVWFERKREVTNWRILFKNAYKMVKYWRLLSYRLYYASGLIKKLIFSVDGQSDYVIRGLRRQKGRLKASSVGEKMYNTWEPWWINFQDWKSVELNTDDERLFRKTGQRDPKLCPPACPEYSVSRRVEHAWRWAIPSSLAILQLLFEQFQKCFTEWIENSKFKMVLNNWIICSLFRYCQLFETTHKVMANSILTAKFASTGHLHSSIDLELSSLEFIVRVSLQI